MSGEKYVQVTERQLNQMMSTCREVDQQQSRNARIQQELAQAEREIRRRAEEVQARYSRYEHALGNMSEEMRRMDEQHARQLREQRQRLDAELSNLGQHVAAQRVEYLELLDQQEHRLSQEMVQQRLALEGQIQDLATTIQRKETHESEQASQWLRDTKALLDEIDSGYRHQAFTPHALDDLRRELHLVEANHRQGLYQAAISSAQQTLLRGFQLRLRLEKLEAEWDAHLAAALTSCRETLAYCDVLTTTRFTLDTVAGQQELDAEIDYWTEGGLRDLLQKVRQRLDALTVSTPEQTSLEVFKNAIANSAAWRQAAEALVVKARENLILSQLRHDIAAKVVDSLGERGWEAVESAYEGEEVDDRGWLNAYHLKLINHAGDEVVTIIEPDSQGGQGANRVTLSYFGKSNDAQFNLNLAKAVGSALAESGLDVAAPRSVPGYENNKEGDQRRRNFEQVRRGTPAGQRRDR